MNDVPTLHSGAGDGNRTRTICLEGRGSTIELHPQGRSYLTGSGRMVITSRSRRWRVVPGRPETLYTRIRRVQQGCGRTRDVAQVGSASALGAEGRRFKSCHPDHSFGSPEERGRLARRESIHSIPAAGIRAPGARIPARGIEPVGSSRSNSAVGSQTLLRAARPLAAAPGGPTVAP